MMLKRIGALFFAASLLTTLCGTAQARPAPSPLEVLTRAVEQSLTFSESEKSDTTWARRLILDCFYLAQISPEKHQDVCRGNPALIGGLQLALVEPDLTSAQQRAIQFYRSNPTGDNPSPPSIGPTAQPAFPYSEDVKKKVIEALVVEIARLSIEYEGASISGSWTRRIAAEAHLQILHKDLLEALGAKSHLLPSDPRACVTHKEILVKAQNAYKAEKRFYDYSAALANTSDVRLTVQTLDEKINRLQILIDSDQPGMFHRARSEIEAALDLSVWNRLTATRSSRLAQQKKRVEKEWRTNLPAALIPEEMNFAVKTNSNSPSLSDLALDAIGSYLLNPVDWVAAESKLLTAYSRMPQSTRNSKSYKQWFASILSAPDLESAILYCKAVVAQAGYQFPGSEPINPKALHQRYLVELIPELQAELNTRKQGRGKVFTSAKIPTDPEALKLQKLYTVRLANDRYSKMAYMPEELRGFVKTVHSEFASTEFEQAISLYNQLCEHMEKGAASNSTLDNAQLGQIATARASVLQAFERLDEVFNERIEAGVLIPNADTRKVKVIVETLKAGRPQNAVPAQTATVTLPSDAPTSLLLPRRLTTSVRKPPLQHTDAIFLSILNNAQTSLKELKGTMAKIDAVPDPIGAKKGKLVLQETDAGIDYSKPRVASDESRLPARLREWNGFTNPRTGKPYDYQKQVKNFRSLAPVGGGIHFGDDASLAAPADFTDFVLSYDEQTQTLNLIGPENKKYSYGPISPQDLKPLLRFARSKQNAAISIGWTGRQETYDRGKESAVLLDPAFVDTQIGNMLVKADNIPWRLDRIRPNGNPSPCLSVEFKRANESWIRQSAAPLSQLFNGIKKFEDLSSEVWQSLFDEESMKDALVLSIVSTNNLVEAKLDYRARTRADEVAMSLGPFSTLTDEQKQKNRNYLNTVAAGLLLLDKRYYLDGSSGRGLLRDLASEENSSGNVKMKWVYLWGTLVKGKYPTITPEEMAIYFLAELPFTTIAVLLDEPTTIHLQGDQILLAGTMRYRYATSRIEVRSDRVMIGASLPSRTNQVRDLQELTQIANDCVPKLLIVHEPLARTVEYAKIIAFLRWARSSKRLLGIDLSNLAAYPASDRARTPTPDAILR